LGAGEGKTQKRIRMKLRIRPTALEDLAKGRRFYDSQELGVGDYFFDSVFADIDSLKLYAGIHRKVFGFHRMLTQRFPYAVYYEYPNKEAAIVWRVLDLRQDPESIRSALGSIKTTQTTHATRPENPKNQLDD